MQDKTKKPNRLLVVLPGIPLLLFIFSLFLFQWYIDSSARSLLRFEREGRLSRTYGYVWQQINAHKAMRKNITDLSVTPDSSVRSESSSDRHPVNYPSIAAITELNNLQEIDKSVRINDRYGIPLSVLKSVQTIVPLSEIDSTLLEALLVSEDHSFYTRNKGYDFAALLRSLFKAGWRSLRTFKLQLPRGSSTIQMQIGRFLLRKSDSRGFAYAEKSLSRKIRELKLAQALFLAYSRDELLTFYCNHCVSAGRGKVGFHDISVGLFGVPPDSLSLPQSLYLARLVKWNRQVPRRILRQIKAALPNLAAHFNWNTAQQTRISRQLDSLSFIRPHSILPENSYLIDLANEYLRKVGSTKGMSASQQSEIDLADPQSMLRLHGSASINLTLDYRLQSFLEKIVASRGFGPDTTITSQELLGRIIDTVAADTFTKDTTGAIVPISSDSVLKSLSLPDSLPIQNGDTLYVHVSHKRVLHKTVVRITSVFKKRSRSAAGQYYAYALMNSRTHELLAYCSRDRLGSRLRSLLVNRNPNGSSVAKPLVYAFAYDLGIYTPAEMTADDTEIPDTCLWSRRYLQKKNDTTGMIYTHVPEATGYAVHNHDRSFRGYDFVFSHLAHSNNIITVETMFRLSSALITRKNDSRIAAATHRLLNLDRTRRRRSPVTGPHLYAAMVNQVRPSGFTPRQFADNYSVALGTLELSLLEQLFLFNALYDNMLVRAPSDHPSLFIRRIQLSGKPVFFSDSTSTVRPFSDPMRIAPVRLALHKRLTSNGADRLGRFDICSDGTAYFSNFAKSGTTDDVIRPFNASPSDTTRTNYGLWNAVLRLRLRRSAIPRHYFSTAHDRHMRTPLDAIPLQEDLDVTLACIGECNSQYTGSRDGKSLHGYVSRELLHAFGIPCTRGFYQSYEASLIAQTPDNIKYAGSEDADLSLFSRALVQLQSNVGTKAGVDEVQFKKARFGKGIRLRGKHLRKMRGFTLYMGEHAREYRKLVGQLKHPANKTHAQNILNEIRSLDISNNVVKRDLDSACESLLASLQKIDTKE